MDESIHIKIRIYPHTFCIDTFQVRYSMRHCKRTEFHSAGTGAQQQEEEESDTFQGYTTFSCHNEPTYLLSRRCDNSYYGAAGPCCKVLSYIFQSWFTCQTKIPEK